MTGARKERIPMQFVICDDNMESLIELEKLLLKYSFCHPGLSFEVEKFSDASVLLDKIRKEKPADIYILDIVMPQITGIELGHEIRKKSKKSIIIYVTASNAYALDAYNVLAIRYLLKPIQEAGFFEALDYALSHMNNKNKPVYLVKTKDGLESIPYHQIEYIENSSRRLEVHLTSGVQVTSIYIRKSFEEEIKELLNTKSFICVHKSFLINLNFIRKLNQNCVTMNSGITIPVSRKSAFLVKKQYLFFISELSK